MLFELSQAVTEQLLLGGVDLNWNAALDVAVMRATPSL
jgi:hypothetical protein